MSEAGPLTRETLESRLIEGINPRNSLVDIYSNAGNTGLDIITLLRTHMRTQKEEGLGLIVPKAEWAIRDWTFGNDNGNCRMILDFEEQRSLKTAHQYSHLALGAAVQVLDLVRALPEEVGPSKHEIFSRM